MTGVCFIVVGNSGSGKDSLIETALAMYPSDAKPIFIPKRYITRPPHESEPFISISEDQFKQMSNQGEFILEWHIYGLYYGITHEVIEKLNQNNHVIINISRAVIPLARKKIPGCKVVFVRVPFEVTMERIRNRGRESDDDPVFLERIERAKNNQDLDEADFIVDNTGPLEEGGKKILNYFLSF